MKIKYRAGYRYQLWETYEVQTVVRAFPIIDTKFIRLDDTGLLTIREGYAWDGASGPGIDTKNFMRGSLVHDACYQLIRTGLLDPAWRGTVDRELQRMVKEDGMSSIRAAWVHWAVSKFGKPYADPADERPVLEAP